MARLRRRSKYGAIPKVVDGIRFASTKEARRYQELKLMEKAGEIESLELQPRFALCVADWRRMYFVILTDCTGEITVGDYVADFMYFDKRKQERVFEDVKGVRTPLYKWKKKHVEAQYGIQIREI